MKTNSRGSSSGLVPRIPTFAWWRPGSPTGERIGTVFGCGSIRIIVIRGITGNASGRNISFVRPAHNDKRFKKKESLKMTTMAFL